MEQHVRYLLGLNLGTSRQWRATQHLYPQKRHIRKSKRLLHQQTWFFYISCVVPRGLWEKIFKLNVVFPFCEIVFSQSQSLCVCLDLGPVWCLLSSPAKCCSWWASALSQDQSQPASVLSCLCVRRIKTKPKKHLKQRFGALPLSEQWPIWEDKIVISGQFFTLEMFLLLCWPCEVKISLSRNNPLFSANLLWFGRFECKCGKWGMDRSGGSGRQGSTSNIVKRTLPEMSGTK